MAPATISAAAGRTDKYSIDVRGVPGGANVWWSVCGDRRILRTLDEGGKGVAAEVDGHAVRFFVVEGKGNSFSGSEGSHGSSPLYLRSWGMIIQLPARSGLPLAEGRPLRPAEKPLGSSTQIR
jgi:hypothetical protein